MYSAFIAGTLFLGTASPLIQAEPPTKPAIDKLIDQLADPDFKVRDQASKAIEALGTDALPRLREAGKQGDAEVRRRIASCIEKIEIYKGKSFNEWIAVLNDYRRPEQQREARQVLGPNGPFAKIAIPELLNALKDDRWGPYSELRKTLTDYGPKGIPAFIKALKRPEWVIRFNAITLLEPFESKAKQAAPALREALKDSNSLVRATAARALANIDSKDKAKETIQALREALKDSNSLVRATAARALSVIDPKELPPLPAGVRRFAMPRRGVVNSPWGGKDSVDKIALSADGKVLASICCYDNKVNLCDVETEKLLRTIELPGESAAIPAFSSDSKLLVTMDRSQAVRIWDIASGKEVRHLLACDWDLSGQVNGVCNISADKKTVAAAADPCQRQPEPFIYVWDATSGKVLVQRQIVGNVFSFSPDNSLLAYYQTGERIPLPRNAIVSGQQSLVRHLKPHLVVAEVATGRILFKEPTEFVVDLQFSSDGRSFACIRHTLNDWKEVAKKPEFCVFELATGKQRARFGTVGRYIFAWSHDTRLCATMDWSGFSVWSVATGKELFHQEIHRQYSGMNYAFSPGNSRFFVGMDDSIVMSWELPKNIRHPISNSKPVGQSQQRVSWQDLADADAAKAYQAMLAFIDAPKEAIPLLKEHLRPVAANPDIGKSSETLAQLRAVEVLEYIGNAEARKVLESIAAGALGTRLTEEAKASLARLAMRN